MKQTDTAVPRSRRAVLPAAAATAAAALVRPLDTTAADGDPLMLGQDNQADTMTRLDGLLAISPTLHVVNEDPDPISLNGNWAITRATCGRPPGARPGGRHPDR